MYISYDEYAALYSGDSIESVFNRLAFDACRYLDRFTTGADGVKKLKVAFPTDEDSVAAVKNCAAKVINQLYQIQEAEKSASMGRGYISTENGLQGKVIASVTSGEESITYSTSAKTGSTTAIDAAVSDIRYRENMLREIVWDYLGGVPDANGVNLLYMGVYPRRYQ